jgi:hypothetical protein
MNAIIQPVQISGDMLDWIEKQKKELMLSRSAVIRLAIMEKMKRDGMRKSKKKSHQPQELAAK